MTEYNTETQEYVKKLLAYWRKVRDPYKTRWESLLKLLTPYDASLGNILSDSINPIDLRYASEIGGTVKAVAASMTEFLMSEGENETKLEWTDLAKSIGISEDQNANARLKLMEEKINNAYKDPTTNFKSAFRNESKDSYILGTGNIALTLTNDMNFKFVSYPMGNVIVGWDSDGESYLWAREFGMSPFEAKLYFRDRVKDIVGDTNDREEFNHNKKKYTYLVVRGDLIGLHKEQRIGFWLDSLDKILTMEETYTRMFIGRCYLEGTYGYGTSPTWDGFHEIRKLNDIMAIQEKSQKILTYPPILAQIDNRQEDRELQAGEILIGGLDITGRPTIAQFPYGQGLELSRVMYQDRMNRLKDLLLVNVLAAISGVGDIGMTPAEVQYRSQMYINKVKGIIEQTIFDIVIPITKYMVRLLHNTGIISLPLKTNDGREYDIDSIVKVTPLGKLSRMNRVDSLNKIDIMLSRVSNLLQITAAVDPMRAMYITERVNWKSILEEYEGSSGTNGLLLSHEEAVSAINQKQQQAIANSQNQQVANQEEDFNNFLGEINE